LIDSPPATNTSAAPAAERPAPDLRRILRESFGFADFRPYQEAVCRAAVAGRDVLLVMPTGAGKSLCYQLPGLARGGTTLVVSPLIALMEDQVAKLKAQGLAAERIHSGRDRLASRHVCTLYLQGKLDFLFIAPERLKVPGFPEMLAKRTLSLIAVDEAHCISNWGHDFRTEYRMLGQRLPLFRPTPVIAMTATATPLVQDDISRQLALTGGTRFIHGFRRTNIGIEVVEASVGERAAIVKNALAMSARRPAIVYTPTRKEAESLAAELSDLGTTAAYHAGLAAADRESVQRAFLAGELSITVATIAFGMGIDKADIRTVIHTALPGSVEAYYQEIGRAGRDGLPSRAILLHSFFDRRTHNFFLDRDYPEPAVLGRLYDALRPEPEPRDTVWARIRRDPDIADEEVFDRLLHKLFVHHGAVSDAEGDLRKGHPGWRAPYIAQREHKRAELDLMTRFAEGHGCRMVALVGHFGDQEDSGEACGLCDACAPGKCYVRRFRKTTPTEQLGMQKILDALGERDSYAVGRLHRDLFEGTAIDRDAFQGLLGALVRARFVVLEEDEFEKDGATIRYERASLGPEAGRRGAALDGVEIDLSGGRSDKRKSSTKSGKKRAPPPWVKRGAKATRGA
jgi:DNA topoisomerase-3